MNTVEVILTVECSLLAVFLLLVGSLIMHKWRTQGFSNYRYNDNNNNSYKRRHTNYSLDRKYIILPDSSARCVEVERHLAQNIDHQTENCETTDDCAVIDETSNSADVGRLYFSLMYETKSCALTIKLIKGENLPTIFQETGKAYVNVEIIRHATDQKTTKAAKTSTSMTYKKTYKFRLHPKDFLTHLVHFRISRFDRFSRRYEMGHVVIALSDLHAKGVDLNRETYFGKEVIPSNIDTFESRKRRHSSDPDQFDDSQKLYRAQRNVKARHRNPQVLWRKLSHAVHEGLFEEIKRSRNESLQWDPFLFLQRCEHSDDDTSEHSVVQESSPRCLVDVHRRRNHGQREPLEEEIPEWLPNVFNSSNDSQSSGSSLETELKQPYTPPQLTKSLNQEFYRLVHSPPLVTRKLEGSITSWSIPETLRLPPSPVRIQTHTVVFQSAPSTHQPRHDRLHKLTSLSSNYRERILRKSRRRSTTVRGRLKGKVSLHESLYLGKETSHSKSPENVRACKRTRKTSSDEFE